MFAPDYIKTRTQDLPPAYQDAAMFYWGWVPSWLNQLPLFSQKSTLVVIPPDRFQDIDTEDDFKAAEEKYTRWKPC